MMTLQQILTVEDDLTLLDFKCHETDFLLWPLIRQEFLQFIISDLVYKNAPLVSLERSNNYPKALFSFFKATCHNLSALNTKADVLLMASGAGLFLKEDKWFNRLSDYFAFADMQNTLVVEDFFNWNWPQPRSNKKVIYHAGMQIYIALSAKLKVKQSHVLQAKEIVSYFKNKAKSELDWDLNLEAANNFERRMARKIAELPIRKKVYEDFLRKKGTKLLIKEEGCYGHSSVLNRTALEMGIVVAEYQHGTLNAGHDGYNIAPSLLSSAEYANTLPQHFLSYGEWWHQYLKLPINKVVVGNPHRTSQLAMLSKRKEKTDILVLGDGVETEMYLDLAIFLSQNLHQPWKVVFRPHPLERSKLKKLLLTKNISNVAIDIELDIYNAFCNAHVVVNEVSTGLFEAVGLADRVLIWDTPKSKFYYPNHPFESFTNAEDLLEKIRDRKSGMLDSQSEDSVWAKDWGKNYKKFIFDHTKTNSLEFVK